MKYFKSNHINHTNFSNFSVWMACVFMVLSGSLIAQDTTPPDAPVIDSVSVQWINPTNPNGDVLITWQASDSADVRTYYIKYLNLVLGTYKLLDSVDANTTSYLDTKVVTDPFYAQTYVIQAVDYANNTSEHSDPHKTVRVFPWQKDENCQVKVELSWNAYQGWNEDIAYYDLYAIKNNTTYHLGQFGPTALVYLQPIYGDADRYEYYVRVTSNNGRTSTSNKIPFTPVVPDFPDYIDARFVTVEDQQIHVQYRLDSLADVNNYLLMRSDDQMQSFHSIMEFPNYSNTFLNITDADVDVNAQPYFYKLYLLNDCQVIVDSSRILSSVWIKGEAFSKDHYQELYWTNYFNSNHQEKTYYLKRYSQSDWPITIFNSTSNFQYKDDLSQQEFESFVGDFCYYIAIESLFDSVQLLKSNTICLSQEPSLIMPTAFAPDGFGENRTFRPYFAFISPNNYYFSIYDRWGNKIFETTDYKEGWTGKKNGYTYKNGMYTYYLNYQSSEGETFKKVGSFNLIN